MMIALTIIGIILSFVVTFCFYRKLQNNKFIKGWSYEAVPNGTGRGYTVTITDPEGVVWGWTGYDSKYPYRFDDKRYHSSNARRTWHVSNTRWIKYRIVQCARKSVKDSRLDARQKVAGTF